MKEFNGYNLPEKATHAGLGNAIGCYYKLGRKWFFIIEMEAKDEGAIKSASVDAFPGLTAKQVKEQLAVSVKPEPGLVEL